MNKFFETIGKILGFIIGAVSVVFKGIFFIISKFKEGFDRGRR